MRENDTFLMIILAIALVFSVWFFATNNSMVTLQEDVEMQKAQIETQLQRRNDLIPNLVATVKGYASHEEKVFSEIADARSKLSTSIQGGNIEEISKASGELDVALGRLLAISEAYPDLKASEQFIALQDELAGTENRISVARQYYNEKVQKYNRKVKMFPSSVVAKIRGFEPIAYFEATESAHDVPTVSFD